MVRLFAELPTLPATLNWLDRPPLPLPLGVRDHVVVLLCWRVGCVHSRIALDQVARVVERFAGRPLVAVAVHAPQSAAEQDLPRVRRAIADRPVLAAVDAGGHVCAALGLRALPAVVLLDGRGRVEFVGHGEPAPEHLGNAIATLLRQLERDGIAPAVPLVPCVAPPPRLLPRALLATPEGVWLAAAGHRRVYCLSPEGEVVRAIGSGVRATRDGQAHVAAFVAPAGLGLHRGHVAVTDDGAHTLRAIDRRDGEVLTWCGDGERSRDRHGGGFGTSQGLAAPAAALSHDGLLYVAQAGTHQLWQVDAETGAAVAWLGATGRALRDGHDEATFREPCGLAADDTSMWVADAGHGALRCIDLAHTFVRTVATGLGRPCAVVVHGTELLLADAFAPAVLRGAIGERGPAAWLDASHGLIEPSALAIVGEVLWIADVGADAVFVVPLAGELEPGAPLQRLPLGAWPALPPRSDAVPRARRCELLRLMEFSDVTLRLRPTLGDDERVDSSLPCTVHIADEGGGLLACDVHHATAPIDEWFEVLVPIADRGEGALRIRIEFTVRGAFTGIPAPRCSDFVVPIAVGPAGELRAEVRPSA